MRKLILLLTLFTITLNFAQDNKFFQLDKNGISDFVVTEVPGKTKEELYNQTLNWINKTYKNPDKVILGKVENDYIRIEGYSDNIYVLNTFGSENRTDSKYQIEISFKDGKYKFDVIELKYIASGYGWLDIPFSNFYKKDGEKKAMFKFSDKIPQYFNDLNKSLLNYIEGKSEQLKNDW